MGAEAARAFSKLIRLGTSLFSAFGVLLSGLLAGDLHGFQLEYLIAFFIVFLSAVGSFAFNDYCDFKIDKRNDRHDRPLVLGHAHATVFHFPSPTTWRKPRWRR